MSQTMNVALSALQTVERASQVTAHNVANVNTAGYQQSRALTEQTASGAVTLRVEQGQLPIDTVTLGGLTQQVEEPANNVVLEEQMVDLISHQRSFEANIRTIRTTDEMQATLFDLFG